MVDVKEDPFEFLAADEDDVVPFSEPKPAPKLAQLADVGVEHVGHARITLKGGGGFDVPWIPLEFGTIDEAHAALTNPDTQRKLAELMDVVAKANALFINKVNSVSPPKSSPSGGAPARPGQEAPAGTPEAPGPGWTYKSGTGKNGKPWKAWMPPRGSDESPVWL